MLHMFIDDAAFTRMLEQHRLVGSLDHALETFESEGWLQPAFRHHREILPSGQTRILDPNMQQQHYKNGEIEFPQKGDYKPWGSFKPKPYEAGQQCTDIYYHEYQLLQVKNILDEKQHSILFRDSYTKSKINEIVNSKVDIMQLINSFNTSQIETTKTVGLLMLLEEHYLRSNSLFWYLDSDHLNNLLREMQDDYSAHDVLHDIDISVEDVRRIRDSLRAQAEHIDPVPGWHDLIRIMRYDVLKKVRGPIHTAHFYYNIVRLLTRFINDLEGSNEPDVPFDTNQINYKKWLYGISVLDYNKQKVRKGIIEYYTRGPTAKLYFLVEGDSEEKVIKEIAKRNKLPYFNDYVTIINCGGVKNMTRKKIQNYIRTARKDSSSVYLIADDENKWEDHLKFITDELGEDFRYTVWKNSFEEDNFGRCNVIRFINSRLQKIGKPDITDEEIKKRQQNGAGMVNAIVKVHEDRYGKTEQRSIYQTIGVGGKSGLALELLDEAYSRGVQDKLEIAKIIRNNSDMIRIWPV